MNNHRHHFCNLQYSRHHDHSHHHHHHSNRHHQYYDHHHTEFIITHTVYPCSAYSPVAFSVFTKQLSPSLQSIYIMPIPTPSFPPPAPANLGLLSLPMHLPTLDISYEWTQTIWSLLYLTLFTQANVFLL